METRDGLILAGLVLMAVSVWLAYQDKWLFAWQMIRHHAAKGYPGIWDGSLLGNITLMSVVIYTIGSYSESWRWDECRSALIGALIIALAAFFLMYKPGLHHHWWAGADQMHRAGFIAMLYTTGLLALLWMFYMHSTVERGDAVRVGLMLMLYLPLANHIVLHYLNQKYGFVWCPHILGPGADERAPLVRTLIGEVGIIGITLAKVLWPVPWLRLLRCV